MRSILSVLILAPAMIAAAALTTNSAMAVMQSGKPEIIANSEGGRTTPSVVAINNFKGRSASAPNVIFDPALISLTRHDRPDCQFFTRLSGFNLSCLSRHT